MAMNCKESLYYFLLITKHKRIPIDCVRHLFQYLVGVQSHLRTIFPRFRLLSQLQPNEISDFIGKNAMVIDCDLTDKETEPCYFNGMIGSLKRYSATQYMLSDIPVHEALFIETLPDSVVNIIMNVLQPCTMLTPESFAFYYKDLFLVPYAAFVSGLKHNNFFYNKFLGPAIQKTSLHHFVLLGMLCAGNFSLGRFERIDLLLDILRFAVSTRNMNLLYRMEVKIDYTGKTNMFLTELIYGMVLMDGYKRSLHPKTIRYDDVLLMVLRRLLTDILDGKASKKHLSKYECMVNLNVKSEPFRFDFQSMVKSAIHSEF